MADIIKKVNALGLLDQYTIAKSLGQEDEFCKSYGINIEKAEGSRGGKVVGHTKSGKPIYARGEWSTKGSSQYHLKKEGDRLHKEWTENHKDFTSEDHRDAAAQLHKKSKENGDSNLLTEASNHITEATYKERKEAEKGLDIDIEKGGKAATIGEIREFGGKKYQKQANGWRPVKKGDQKSEGKKEDQSVPTSKDIEEYRKKLIDYKAEPELSSWAKNATSEEIKDRLIGAGQGKFKRESSLDLSKHSKQDLLDAMAARAKSGVSESDPEMKQLQAELDKRGDEGEKISASLNYGDALFSSKEKATNPNGKLTKPENYSVVAMKDGRFARTTNNRASKFEKQGDGEIIGKFDPNQQFRDKKPELDLGAKKLMSLVSVFSNKYNDITKVSVYGTDKGNWAVLYNGKEIGTIGGNQLSDETVQKYNLEEHNID